MGIRNKQPGFTLIETMLVFAITGLLLAAVLVSSTIAVNQQRYRDSVVSLLGLIQSQYSMVLNVQNADRTTDKFTCDSTDGLKDVTSDPVPGTPRGSSDCAIIGRVINISNGTDVTVANVVGYRDDTQDMPDNDITALSQYQKISIVSSESDTSQVAWGAQVVQPGGSFNDVRTLGILLLRSPASGSIFTFTNNTAVINNSNISGMIAAAKMTEQKLCVDGGLFTGPRDAVVVHAGASSPNAVEQTEVGNGC